MRDPKFNHLNTEDSIKVVTAYHPSIGKRIIVDVFLRAVALETAIRDSKRNNIPKVTVWECYERLVTLFLLNLAIF